MCLHDLKTINTANNPLLNILKSKKSKEKKTQEHVYNNGFLGGNFHSTLDMKVTVNIH